MNVTKNQTNEDLGSNDCYQGSNDRCQGSNDCCQGSNDHYQGSNDRYQGLNDCSKGSNERCQESNERGFGNLMLTPKSQHHAICWCLSAKQRCTEVIEVRCTEAIEVSKATIYHLPFNASTGVRLSSRRSLSTTPLIIDISLPNAALNE